MPTEPDFDVFREQHAQLSFHVAALMIATLQLKEAEQQVALGALGNVASQQTQVAYQKAKIKALVTSL